MNQIYEQSRHQKFLDLIIDNFIPESEKEKIEKCTTWDEEKETYKMHAPKFKSTFQYFIICNNYLAKKRDQFLQLGSKDLFPNTVELLVHQAKILVSNMKILCPWILICQIGLRKIMSVINLI